MTEDARVQSKKPLNSKSAFLAGASGTVAVYGLFWIRHSDVVRGTIAEDLVYALITGFVLLAFAVIAGFIVCMTRPDCPKTAFFTGLGFPAIIFAVSLGPIATPPTAPPPTTPGEGVTPRLPRQMTALDSLRMVVSPVSAVSRYHERDAIMRVDDQLVRIAQNPEEEDDVRASAENLRWRLHDTRIQRLPGLQFQQGEITAPPERP